MINGRTYGFAKTDAEELVQLIGNGDVEYLEGKVRGGGGGAKFFKLIEDSTSSTSAEFWAVPVTNPAGASPGTPPVEVTPWVAAGAQVDYVAMYERIGGKWYFSQGPCFTVCTTEGTLAVGTAPSGKVDELYSHAVTGTGLVGGNYSTVDFTDLPPGLDHTFEAINGTPTKAGTYYVIVTADAPGSGESTGSTCTITKVLVVTIEEADPEPQFPDPAPYFLGWEEGGTRTFNLVSELGI